LALTLYILSLGISGGIVGVFVRQVLGGQGYVHGFRMALLLAGGCAALYVAAQLAYMTLVRLLKPTRSPGPLLCEILSHLAALVFLPYLLQMPVPWPHPAMAKAEVLIYLGAFGAFHALFKLASFFAAIRGEPSGRLGAAGWLLTTCASGVAAYIALSGWLREMEQVRPHAPGKQQAYRVGDAYASAREAPEGAQVDCHFEYFPGVCLSMQWAAPAMPEADESGAPERLYVTVAFEGVQTEPLTRVVILSPAGWTPLEIPSESIPQNCSACSVLWESQKAPSWRGWVRVRPVVRSGRNMLLSGPFSHASCASGSQVQHGNESQQENEESPEPSILLIAVEGLAAQHLSCMGHKRNTTPALDRLAQTSQVFANAYTPAPEAAAACMTLLTGVHPLRHAFLGARHGPLPAQYDTLAQVFQRRHYATAAFTEGEGEDDKDLIFGDGFERGFEIFDSSYRAVAAAPDEPAASAATIRKVAEWIEALGGQKFFVFVRLRELRDPRWSERYAPGFVADPAAPLPVDVYDSALMYLDRQIGELVKRIRAVPGGKNTCIVVTSSYGLDFSSGSSALPTVGLSEGSLRVPLLIHVPGLEKTDRRNIAALEDVAPTLMTLARTGLDYIVDGKELLQNPADRSPVSMFGNPLAMSIRVDRWRLTWQSGRTPFVRDAAGPESVIELIDVIDARKRGDTLNVMSKHPEFVTRYRARLQSLLQ